MDGWREGGREGVVRNKSYLHPYLHPRMKGGREGVVRNNSSLYPSFHLRMKGGREGVSDGVRER